MLKRLHEHKGIIVILLIFGAFLSYFGFASGALWWDSSVFLGMGKYLYSAGGSGLYEGARPLMWPLMLGLFWKLGLDSVILGKILLGLFGLGCVGLTYVLGNRFFSKRVALLGSLFLTFSGVFFLFSSVLHSEIPSLFFLLLGVYSLVMRRYLYSGLFFGIAVMTRFFQIFVVVGVVCYLIREHVRKKVSLTEVLWFGGSFLLPVIPFLIYWYVRHGSLVYPFALQGWMTLNTGWIYQQPFGFYFVELFRSNVFVVLALVGTVVAYRQKKVLLLMLFVFSFVPYLFVAHKEMRLILQTLPFLFLMAGEGILVVARRFGGYSKMIFAVVLLVFLVQALPQIEGNNYEGGFEVFVSYLENVPEDELVWISNPGFVAGSDHGALLMYYPLYSTEKIAWLRERSGNAGHILMSSCDVLPCKVSDALCEQEHGAFLAELEESHRKVYASSETGCDQVIYAR